MRRETARSKRTARKGGGGTWEESGGLLSGKALGSGFRWPELRGAQICLRSARKGLLFAQLENSTTNDQCVIGKQAGPADSSVGRQAYPARLRVRDRVNGGPELRAQVAKALRVKVAAIPH